MKFDVEGEDDYGWLLAYAYLSAGSMLNETHLQEGCAQIATSPPDARDVERFKDAQREAHGARRSL